MRYASRLNVPIATIGAAVLATVIVLAYVGGSSGDGGGDEPLTLQEAIDSTPPPPSGPRPTPNPNLPGFHPRTPGPTPTPLTSVEVSGVVIPIPEGARHHLGGAAETLEGHWIQLGDSLVIFDDIGLAVVDIKAADEQAYEPTLDAIWTLTQKVGTPSPLSLVVDGADIPLPEGSYYSAVEGWAMGGPETIIRHYVRLERSVLWFQHWIPSIDGRGLVANNVRPDDEALFQPTLDALALLALGD